MYSLPGYDAWVTDAPEDDFGVCPNCGASQEEAEPYGDLWVCGICGDSYTDDEAHPDYADMRDSIREDEYREVMA